MKYAHTKNKITFEVEILNDGLRYLKKSKDENFTKFVQFESVSDDIHKYETVKYAWTQQIYVWYFLVLAFCFGGFSYVTDGVLGFNAVFFIFVALVFWLIGIVGKLKYSVLMGSGYDSGITLFDSEKSNNFFSEIKHARNKFLKNKYLNDDGTLKNMPQQEHIIRNMSILGLLNNDLVATVAKHNEEHYKTQNNAQFEA